jgi:hypothetical protein
MLNEFIYTCSGKDIYDGMEKDFDKKMKKRGSTISGRR